MSILAGRNTKVLVQGMTGTQASFHTKRSLDYGTDIVAGVTPGKGGTVHLGLPVFDTVKEAAAETGATASLMFVPARMVKSAVAEAAEAGLDLAVCISDNVPVRDMLEVRNILKNPADRPQHAGSDHARRSPARHFSGKHSYPGADRHCFPLFHPHV